MNSHQAGTSFSWTLGGMNILMRPGQFSSSSPCSWILMTRGRSSSAAAVVAAVRRVGQLDAVIQQQLRLNQPSGAFREHNVPHSPSAPPKNKVQDELHQCWAAGSRCWKEPSRSISPQWKLDQLIRRGTSGGLGPSLLPCGSRDDVRLF